MVVRSLRSKTCLSPFPGAAEQAEKLPRYARQYAGARVGLMHDADVPGDEGAKESLWRLHELGIEAYLVWSRKKLGGKYADRQPERLTAGEWQSIVTKNVTL